MKPPDDLFLYTQSTDSKINEILIKFKDLNRNLV